MSWELASNFEASQFTLTPNSPSWFLTLCFDSAISWRPRPNSKFGHHYWTEGVFAACFSNFLIIRPAFDQMRPLFVSISISDSLIIIVPSLNLDQTNSLPIVSDPAVRPYALSLVPYSLGKLQLYQVFTLDRTLLARAGTRVPFRTGRIPTVAHQWSLWKPHSFTLTIEH